MSKASYIEDLHKSHIDERSARWHRAFSPYKNRGKDRWDEVRNAHNRNRISQDRRSVGKSNKIGTRRSGKGMCGFLLELSELAQITRGNRKEIGMPARVYRISHKGEISYE